MSENNSIIFQLCDISIQEVKNNRDLDYLLFLPSGEGMGIKKQQLKKAILKWWAEEF